MSVPKMSLPKIRWRLTKSQVQALKIIGVLVAIGLLHLMYLRFIPPELPELVVFVVAAVVAAVVLIFIGGYHYNWSWTGFSEYTNQKPTDQGSQRRKTLWDWMQLLIIPAVLAGGALWFNGRSASVEHDIAHDNQREVALQTYFDRMSELLLDKGLRTSGDSEVSNMARTRTLSTLRILDGPRKGILLKFLHDSQLISGTVPIVNLSGADLTGANLSLANLRGANLRGANLSGTHPNSPDRGRADLDGADLTDADLSDAALGCAYLDRVHLICSSLDSANLTGANLSGAYVRDAVRAKLIGANLRGAHLNNADLSMSDLSNADLSDADLTGADLSDSAEPKFGGTSLRGAHLNNADLDNTNLSFADLTSADLTNTTMFNANLRDAKVTPEQLAKAKYLKGAIMPDGSKHQ